MFNDSSGYLNQDPNLKQSLMESFSKMDTEQLKEVGYSIGSEFALSLNDIFVEGENLSKDETQEKIDQFWIDKFGTTQKILDMFNEKLEYFIREHERGEKDYTYVFEAFEILTDSFLSNSKKVKS